MAGEIVLKVRMDPAVEVWRHDGPGAMVPDPAGNWVRLQDLPMEVEDTPSQEAARQAAVDGPLRRGLDAWIAAGGELEAIDRDLYTRDATYHAVVELVRRLEEWAKGNEDQADWLSELT